MKYDTGESVKLWDEVSLGGSMTGVIVAIIETNEFSAKYPAEEWSYLRVGALVESPEGGLMHYANSENDLYLVKRGDPRDKD